MNFSTDSSRNDQGSLDALSPIITAMGMSSIGSFIDRDRFNIVVEGISDHYYLSAFKKLLTKDNRLCFVPAIGVNNVPNVVSVLIGWGYSFKAVFDDDKDAGRKAYNLLKKELFENDDTQAHEYIYKIKGCHGIEDVFSQKDFHKYVLNSTYNSTNTKSNSELATGKKELLAREFLEKVNNSTTITLDQNTLKKVEEIFSWIYRKYGISA